MRIIRALADESVLLLALISAVAVALDLPEEWQNVLLAAVPLLLAVLVRQVTSSPATVVDAVENAAMRTATVLASDTVGVSGAVTERGEQIVDGVVDGVVNKVGGLVPKLARRD